MRNIVNYEEEYINERDLSCRFEEKYQVKYRQKMVSNCLEKYKHDSILEVGCARESQGNFISDMKQFVIVEPGKIFIEKAKKDLEGKEIHYVEGFLENSIEQLKKWSFNFIIVGSLLHELEKPSEFLKSLRCLCDRETVIHVNVPNARSLHRLLAEKSGFIKDIYTMSDRNKLFQQHEVFDLDSLSRLIQECGGEILDKGSYFIKPFTHDQMMRCLQDGIISDEVLEGLDKIIDFMPEFGSEIYVNFRFLL